MVRAKLNALARARLTSVRKIQVIRILRRRELLPGSIPCLIDFSLIVAPGHNAMPGVFFCVLGY
ncbi:MAG: hypothetical protein ACJA13_003316 [Paraglaciecola sp.]|jgi:hypothetical protein